MYVTSHVILCSFSLVPCSNPFNPRLASSSKDNSVRVWSMATRNSEYVLGGHTASVNVVRWGGGGASGKGILYTAGSDRCVRIWDADGVRHLPLLLSSLPLYTYEIHRESFYTNSKIMHTGSQHWLSTPTSSCALGLTITQPRSHLLMPKARIMHNYYIFTYSYILCYTAQLWALSRYTALTVTTSELLISGSDDHTLFLWDLFPTASETTVAKGAELNKPKPQARLTGHQRQISHVVFSPDGRWAASASWDNSLRIWEGKTGRYIATLRGHIAPVYRVAWSADSRLLISASKDSTLKVWPSRCHMPLHPLITVTQRYGI